MATMNAPAIERRTIPDRRIAMGKTHGSVMSALDYIAMALLIIGGLNWGLVGLFNVDLVASLFGAGSPGTRLVYMLVGLSALYSIYLSVKMGTTKRTS